MGVFSLAYRRPSYVSNENFRHSNSSLNEDDKASARPARSSGIPDELSFEKIIEGSACPPMTLRDFMNYLLYMEHSAENLQFYLWHQDYLKRFNEATTSDLALAPEWTKAMEEEAAAKLREDAFEKMRRSPPVGEAIFNGTDFEKKPVEAVVSDINPFSTPPQTPHSVGTSDRDSTLAPSTHATVVTYRSQASDAFTAAGVKTPFTIQPYREEINRIIATYIMEDAPRQLNLSDRDRKAIMHALSYTTHPSALRVAFASVDYSLRRQSHPNFIRWAIVNASPTRISFARNLGYQGAIGGFIVAILCTLSSAARGWRAMAAIGWVLGIGAVVASYRGMCICMYTFSWRRHQIYPWELFVDAEEGGRELEKRSFESFGSSNSFEQEPWVVKYAERNMWRKIFEKEAPIQESSVRRIHDAIFVQSMLIGLLAGGILTAIFVPLPAGHFF